MKQKILFLASILLLITACAQLPGGQTRETAAAGAEAFRTGTEGLRATFVQNLPPARIFDTEPLSVTIQVENRGTARQVQGRIYLSGFDPSIITGVSTAGIQIPDLQPRDQFTPQGGIDFLSFPPSRIASLQQKGIDRYPARLQATLCYQYRTTGSANVCLDPNPFSATVQQKVCTPASVSTGSQGAPIAVSIVELDPALGKTRFRIKIQNVGGGEAFKSASLAKCSPYSEGLKFDEIDYIKVLKVNIMNRDIRQSCDPLDDGFLRLTQGAATLFCEVDLKSSGTATFISPLVVELEYGYRTTQLKTLDILPAGQP